MGLVIYVVEAAVLLTVVGLLGKKLEQWVDNAEKRAAARQPGRTAR